MKLPAPTRKLAEKPDLDQLKRQAKELLDGFRSHEPNAVKEVQLFCYSPNSGTFALHDAQLVLARSYGFDSWPKLKAYPFSRARGFKSAPKNQGAGDETRISEFSAIVQALAHALRSSRSGYEASIEIGRYGRFHRTPRRPILRQSGGS